jgi:hypothetical protein
MKDVHTLLDGAWKQSVARVRDAQAILPPGGADGPQTDAGHLDQIAELTRRFEEELEDRPGRSALVDALRWDRTAELAGLALSESAAKQGRREYRRNHSASLENLGVVDVLNAAWRRRLLPASCEPAAAVPADQASESRRLAAMVSYYVWPSLQRPSHGAGLTRVSGRGR